MLSDPASRTRICNLKGEQQSGQQSLHQSTQGCLAMWSVRDKKGKNAASFARRNCACVLSVSFFFAFKKFGLPKNASHNKDAARTVQVLSIVGPEDRDCILQMQASNLKEQCACASRHRALGLLLL